MKKKTNSFVWLLLVTTVHLPWNVIWNDGHLGFFRLQQVNNSNDQWPNYMREENGGTASLHSLSFEAVS